MAHFYSDRDVWETELFEGGELPDEQESAPGGGEELPDEREGAPDGSGEQENAELRVELTLGDGRTLACRGLAVFLAGGKEYMALETEQAELEIMELLEGEDDSIRLEPIQDGQEREAAFQEFWAIYEPGRGDVWTDGEEVFLEDVPEEDGSDEAASEENGIGEAGQETDSTDEAGPEEDNAGEAAPEEAENAGGGLFK